MKSFKEFLNEDSSNFQHHEQEPESPEQEIEEIKKERDGYMAATQNSELKDLVKKFFDIEIEKISMTSDPMTSAMGAPVGEFMSDYNKKQLPMADKIYKIASSEGNEKLMKLGMNKINEFMP